jgi:uncharacterized protein
VVDQAHLLSREQAGGIAAQSASLEQRTKHQFVVVTVTTLGGRDIADYSTALGTRWGVGRKGVNDGVLLVVAPTERKVRIAVAEGLRKALTDAEAKAIIEQTILPAFRARHFDQGIIKGADRIMSELSETKA